jgi:hypothetical protein
VIHGEGGDVVIAEDFLFFRVNITESDISNSVRTKTFGDLSSSVTNLKRHTQARASGSLPAIPSKKETGIP